MDSTLRKVRLHRLSILVISTARRRFRLEFAGFFLFFIFSGLSMLLLQLLFEAAALLKGQRELEELRRLRVARRLCYVTSGKLVVAPRIGNGEYHLFLSHVVS
jgi:hypothetical protein